MDKISTIALANELLLRITKKDVSLGLLTPKEWEALYNTIEPLRFAQQTPGFVYEPVGRYVEYD